MAQSVWHEILGWQQGQIEELRTLAYCYARQGTYEVARDLLHMIHAVAPGGAYEAQLLGAIYLEEGDLKKGIHWLEEALRIAPGDRLTQLNQAKAYLAHGEIEKGLTIAKQLRNDPDSEIAQDAQALLLSYRRAA